MPKCTYCGEEEGTEKIANPNLDMGDNIDWNDKDSWWIVCKDCKEVIHLQQMSDFPDEKFRNECIEKLAKIAKKTGKPILNACISKKQRETREKIEKLK